MRRGVNGMKQMSHWGKLAALLALGLSAVGGMKATATVFTSTSTANLILESTATPSHKRGNLQLAQRRTGECRAARRAIFIYQERSTANPIRALQTNEQVRLAEERGRTGWIAISSPISGFVQAQDLKFCSEDSPRSSQSELCRRVAYQGDEGLVVRERANLNSRPVARVYGGDRVTLTNPPQFFVADDDPEEREWVRLSAPVAGWVSNGSRVNGGLNLVSCFYD
jgi:hypothetical protein